MRTRNKRESDVPVVTAATHGPTKRAARAHETIMVTMARTVSR